MLPFHGSIVPGNENPVESQHVFPSGTFVLPEIVEPAPPELFT